MEFRILGGLTVVDGARNVTPPRPKQRALLALLLLRAGELVTWDEAADALWDGEPPAAARNAIQGHVAALRKLLGRNRIETRGAAYVLALEDDELDLLRFERLVGEARGRQPAERAELLASALALFRGEPLQDFRYAGFAAAEARRIDELRLHALEARIEAELALGRHESVVPELEALIDEAPLREGLWRQLVLALYRSGRQADALAAYARARAALDELGLEPGPELRRLERRVLQQDPALDLPDPVAAVRLPSPPTAFVGRRRELEELAELLASPRRILTLVGPGGSGKTRLAIEAARTSASAFPGGVVLVELAPVADPELVVPLLARVLDAAETGRPLEDELRERLGDRPALVVLDNVEHVAAAAPALGRVVAAAAGLTVLATSREPLKLYGEHLYRVEPLDPDAAAELFVRHAEAAGTRDADPAVVAEICRTLDGLPLAIELAAARTDVLPPAALLERLAAPLDLLQDGAVDKHPRQQTLRRTLEWSHDRLAPDEQVLFARLAVFAGGWTIDAADAVCGGGLDVVAGLSSLLDKSLLQPAGAGGAPRQTMLETIRGFARERLAASGEDALLRSRHLAFFLALAEEAEPNLRGSPGDWLDRLELELSNLRAALDAAPAAERLRLAGALWRLWYLRGHLSEGRRQLERALVDAPPDAARAKALLGAAVMAANTSDPETAHRRAAEARSLCAELGDAWGEAYAAFMLGNVGADAGTARRDYEAAIASFRALGDEHSALLASRHLAMLLAETGDADGARALHADNLERARASDNGRIAASSLGALAESALAEGRRQEAVALLRESLALHRELGDVLDTAVDLCRFAAAVAPDDPVRAAMLLAAVDAAGEAVAGRRASYADLNGETLALAAQLLGPEELERARSEGLTLSLEGAVARALA